MLERSRARSAACGNHQGSRRQSLLLLVHRERDPEDGQGPQARLYWVFAALTIAPYFAMSALIIAVSYSGAIPAGSMPMPFSFSFVSGAFMTRKASRYSRETIAAGDASESPGQNV